MYSTGGTILFTSAYSRLDNLAYGGDKSKPVTIQDVIDAVPEVLDIAQIGIVSLPPRISNNLTSQDFVNISRHFAEHVGSENSDIAGAVISHGTNTLTETVSPG